MGNSSTKEARSSTSHESRADRAGTRYYIQEDAGQTPQNEHGPTLRVSRGRHDGSFLGIGSANPAASEQRRETKQERDARRAQRERAARLKERERSLREEGVDGGYLVTLGTYTGPEDFSKSTVRQLMLERRLAPFWRGLNDHSDSWTEHQLVAAAKGLPIPAPDEIPPDTDTRPSQHQGSSSKPIPIQSGSDTKHANTPSSFTPLSNNSHTHSASSPLFRGRSRTLASVSSKNDSQTDLAPQEINLPYEPLLKDQKLEAHLYKDVMECPICFLYYPPYLNRTRCCDQPICSECFVQIKRPDPHPPEHLDPNSPVPEDVKRQEEAGQLVSEPAACPFCVQSEFGITYEPPPFRRGLAYANNAFSKSASAMASSPYGNGGLQGPRRRRGQSISATAPGVITTDKVRPDWVKKLSDARAHAARRSAAATALHTAAFMMGGAESGRLAFGRRRRHFGLDISGTSGDGTPEGMSIPNMEMLMAVLAGEQGSSRSGRTTAGASSRADDLEELLLMEAIRQSLAAEEERKKKEEKENAKQAKRDEKQKVKEQKKADKAAKKGGLYSSSTNTSSFFSGGASPTTSTATAEGKGKQRAPEGETDQSGGAAISVNTVLDSGPTLTADSSGHASATIAEQSRREAGTSEVSLSNNSSKTANFSSIHPRQASDASSSGSSVGGLSSTSSRYQLATAGTATEIPALNPGTDSPFSFGSLAAMIDEDRPVDVAEPANDHVQPPGDRGNSGSSLSASLPRYEEQSGDARPMSANTTSGATGSTATPAVREVVYDDKAADMSVFDEHMNQQRAS